jgi:hypothetical protein
MPVSLQIYNEGSLDTLPYWNMNDYELQCFEPPAYKMFMLLSLLMIVVYVLGWPLLVFVVMRYYHTMQVVTPIADMPEQTSKDSQFKFTDSQPEDQLDGKNSPLGGREFNGERWKANDTAFDSAFSKSLPNLDQISSQDLVKVDANSTEPRPIDLVVLTVDKQDKLPRAKPLNLSLKEFEANLKAIPNLPPDVNVEVSYFSKVGCCYVILAASCMKEPFVAWFWIHGRARRWGLRSTVSRLSKVKGLLGGVVHGTIEKQVA